MKKHPARSIHLSIKLTICLIGGMVIIFSIVGYQNVALHKRHLEEMMIASADRISDTVKRSTRYSMMKNHRDEVYQIIKTIGAQPGMNKVRIFNEEGKISFSTDEEELVAQVDKKAEACYGCHAQEQPLSRLNRPDRIRIYTSSTGERILGLINPIENETTCSSASCHAHPADKQVLGVLDVTMSLAKVDETIAIGERKMIATYIAAMIGISMLVGGLIWIMVHKPVSQLIVGTNRVAAGDLDYKINLSSRDEVGALAASFNRMTVELKQANSELNQWARTLEQRVEQKTEDLKRIHDRIVQVERMASIGKLAAIVAHEINNPLAGILVSAKLLLKRLKGNGVSPFSSAETKQQLDMIAGETARCGEIVKNLLQFSRQTKSNLQPNDLNFLIRHCIRLVQHKIDLMSITADLQLNERIPLIVCDAQQLTQVFVALFINACEAMKPEEGVLRVVTSYSTDRHAVEVRISDNGIGMDEETKTHIFEPFFTTKEHGKGAGLGLAVVYGIVQAHSGEIEVRSDMFRGSTFTLWFPERPAAAVQSLQYQVIGQDHGD